VQKTVWTFTAETGVAILETLIFAFEIFRKIEQVKDPKPC